MDFLNMSDQTEKQTEPYRFFGTQEEGIVGKRDLSYDDAPIGVFDSGFGGLTVAREIMKALCSSHTQQEGRGHCNEGHGRIGCLHTCYSCERCRYHRVRNGNASVRRDR